MCVYVCMHAVASMYVCVRACVRTRAYVRKPEYTLHYVLYKACTSFSWSTNTTMCNLLTVLLKS